MSGKLKNVKSIVKNLLNVIEDRRIDYYIYSTSPTKVTTTMYDKYFNSKIVDKGLKSSEYRDWIGNLICSVSSISPMRTEI